MYSLTRAGEEAGKQVSSGWLRWFAGCSCRDSLHLHLFDYIFQLDTVCCCVLCDILNWVSVLPSNNRSDLFLYDAFFFHAMKN